MDKHVPESNAKTSREGLLLVNKLLNRLLEKDNSSVPEETIKLIS